ncbi:hypothetical protein A1Q2_05165 [Trichosporon asahii var. asahii CBS 8904]|uniref:Uncharacterized protein n=1 Tax=Trichosporon asahii var. asahii (strain CBS 8904) TaxID=1220162 RepID=K1V911_TRIAC|nr:hypothetical protein A1Q2_05165 [Trichosporon asahii var. asahii CBS 8904]
MTSRETPTPSLTSSIGPATVTTKEHSTAAQHLQTKPTNWPSGNGQLVARQGGVRIPQASLSSEDDAERTVTGNDGLCVYDPVLNMSWCSGFVSTAGRSSTRRSSSSGDDLTITEVRTYYDYSYATITETFTSTTRSSSRSSSNTRSSSARSSSSRSSRSGSPTSAFNDAPPVPAPLSPKARAGIAERFEVDESLIVTPHTETAPRPSEVERPLSAAFSTLSCDTNRPLPALPLVDGTRPLGNEMREVTTPGSSSLSASKVLAAAGSSSMMPKTIASSTSTAKIPPGNAPESVISPVHPSAVDDTDMDAPPQYDPRWSAERSMLSSSPMMRP